MANKFCVLKPPVGDLRWMPPQKLPTSRRRYDATIYGPGMLLGNASHRASAYNFSFFLSLPTIRSTRRLVLEGLRTSKFRHQPRGEPNAGISGLVFG